MQRVQVIRFHLELHQRQAEIVGQSGRLLRLREALLLTTAELSEGLGGAPGELSVVAMKAVQLRGESLIEKRIGRRGSGGERGERFLDLVLVPGVAEEIVKSLEFQEAFGVELGEPLSAKRFFSHDPIITGSLQIFGLREEASKAQPGPELLSCLAVARRAKKFAFRVNGVEIKC